MEVWCFKMNKQFEKYLYHKKRFDLEETTQLKLFEEFLQSAPEYLIECSCKVKKEEMFPYRFNVFFDKNLIKSTNCIFDFLKNISENGAILNYDILKKIFSSKINIKKLEVVSLGIDFRKELKDSRVKCFFETNSRYYELFNLAMNLHGVSEKVSEVMFKNRLIIGVDLFFDGKTQIKLYAPFKKFELKNEVIFNNLNKIFPNQVFELLSKNKTLYISFKGPPFNRILSFYPKDLNKTTKQLDNKILTSLANSIDYSLDDCIVSLEEEEINIGKIENFNFYY